MVDIEAYARTRWDNQRFAIGRLGSHALAPPVDFQPDLKLVTSIKDKQYTARNGYELLGLLRAVEFQGLDPIMARRTLTQGSQAVSPEQASEREYIWQRLRESETVVFGFLMMGRILGYAPRAYQRFCQANRTEPSLSGMETILAHPKSFEQTAQFLAKMHGRSENKIWEEAAGLGNTQYEPASDFTPFVITQETSGELTLGINPAVQVKALAKIRESSQLTPRSIGECPAADVFLSKLWSKMLSECVATPELYPAEIQAMAA